LKNKFFTKTSDEGIYDSIVGSNDTAIICVECNDAVIANKETGITHGLMKSLIEQALYKVLIPIESGLFASVQILFELNEIAWICEFRVVILAKFLL